MMKRLLKKFGVFLLNIFRPLFAHIAESKKDFFQKLRQTHTDPYLCGMINRFSFLHEWIFKPYFEKVRTDSTEITHLKELSQKGTLVYVMKNRGQLEYSFFNHLFLKEGIPLARFANGCRTFFWRPFKEMILATLYRLDLYYTRGRLEDPIRSGYLEHRMMKGESALLNLKVSREFVFGVADDPLEFILPLIRAAQKSEKPIYLMTQQFIHDRRPEKAKKSWADFLFGEKSNPGMIRKLIMFFLSYRQRASVKFGEPLDLRQFVMEQTESDPKEIAVTLKNILLSRLMIERKSITGPVLKRREHFLDKILRSKAFKDTLEVIAQETGKSAVVLSKEATDYFNEIAARVNYSYVDLYDLLVHWMFTHIYEGLEIDFDGLSKIKALAGKHPVVLVPSHKSHIDYLLLSYIFYNHDLTLPHVCSGINLKFWPAGPLIRRGGGFFIRRTFKGNHLYKLVLEEYLQTLIREGYSIEFFIEGTRSRTGKLLKPKMGILSMLMEGYLKGTSGDIHFVPIAINYERLLEATSYAEEIHGASKEKENVAGVIKVRSKLGKKYGKVFVQFADPISLKGYLDEKNIKPGERNIDECRREIEEFAYQITYNINKESMITATSLVTMALLSYSKKGIPETEVLKRTRILKRYLEFKEANLSDLLREKEHWAIQEALQKLAADRMVNAHQDFREKFYTIDEEKRTTLDYHKNNSIHFFVSLVCFSKIVSTAHSQTLTMNEIEKQYETLKTLLRHDFTFSQRASLRDHLLKVISFYEKEKILHYDPAGQTVTLMRPVGEVPLKSGTLPLKSETWPGWGNSAFDLYCSLLDNFFESYYLTLLYVKHIAFEKADRKKLIPIILEKGKALYLKGDLKFSEALSRFNIESALSVFLDVGLIQVDESGLLTRNYDQESIEKWQEILETLLGMENYAATETDLSRLILEEKTVQHTDLH